MAKRYKKYQNKKKNLLINCAEKKRFKIKQKKNQERKKNEKNKYIKYVIITEKNKEKYQKRRNLFKVGDRK